MTVAVVSCSCLLQVPSWVRATYHVTHSTHRPRQCVISGLDMGYVLQSQLVLNPFQIPKECRHCPTCITHSTWEVRPIRPAAMVRQHVLHQALQEYCRLTTPRCPGPNFCKYSH